ncbi:transcription termination factor Rho [uncultured Bifidobacterium sp.]|uniref:transcription termination factor Rho n=1 Tax=uncultured Bifidobacterium sp. TaxID=165187 RepID=UPI00260C357B|nr:transcription termination factor Rho [uncultured Bifidobacterium sp.]
MAISQNLEDMKLPELRDLARQMGLRGTSTMRKPALVQTLKAARSGGQAPEGVTVASRGQQDASVNTKTVVGSEKSPAAGEKKSVSDDETPRTQVSAKASPFDSVQVRTPVPDASTLDHGDHGDHGASAGADSSSSDNQQDDSTAAAPMRLRRREPRASNGGETRRRRRRESEEAQPEVRDLSDILAALPEDGDDSSAQKSERDESRRGRGRAERDRDRERGAGRERSTSDRHPRRRGRDRSREDSEETDARSDRRDDWRESRRDDRRDDHREDRRDDRRDQPREESSDSRVPVAGIVDVLDSYAFVRTSGYLPGPNDVYVSMGQVRKYGLRKGDAVQGSIRTPREGDRRNQRQKFVPLQSIDTINGMSVEEASHRPQFSKLIPLYPQERLKQETTPNRITGRLIDIVSPIGKGQRGLIVSPPKAGKTITLQNIANSIAVNNPEVHLMVVLVDERPEEVTDMERTVQGEVISSTFDRPASDHTMVAELAIERAKRLVELGQDVVVLLDSMTRLARAYNIAAPASGRILSGGVDAQALYPPKKFFGAARNIENGGSLTIISSALVETGSKMDEVIFEEFKGTGNMELRLSRDLADRRLFPAIDVNASGTRREELITPKAELPIIYRLRRLMGGMEPEQAYQVLVPRLKKTASNHDFLAAIVQQSNLVNSN